MSEAAENPSGNSSREQDLQNFRQEAKEYAVNAGLDPDKVSYWEGKAREILDTYGSDFNEFVEGHREMVEEGERIIEEIESTGFNVSFVLDEDDFPFESNELFIFYSNYIDIPEHFGLLLAEMENGQLITRDQVKFSKKATEVILGEWEGVNLPQDVYTLERKGGPKVEIGRTVETLLFFSIPDDEQADENALKIIRFLLEKAKKIESKQFIPGSFVEPDIRMAQGFIGHSLLREVTESGDFVDIVSNRIPIDGGKLIVLRTSTRFEEDEEKKQEGWKSLDTPVNKELAQFVEGHGVGP